MLASLHGLLQSCGGICQAIVHALKTNHSSTLVEVRCGWRKGSYSCCVLPPDKSMTLKKKTENLPPKRWAMNLLTFKSMGTVSFKHALIPKRFGMLAFSIQPGSDSKQVLFMPFCCSMNIVLLEQTNRYLPKCMSLGCPFSVTLGWPLPCQVSQERDV